MGIYGVMMGVAIVAVALLGMVSLFQGVMTSQRTQTVMNTISVMETTIRRSFANRPEFEGGGALEGISISAVPTTAIRGTGAGRDIVTPWGGDITTGAGDTIGTDAASPNRFWILVVDIPEEACETIGVAHLDRRDVIGVDADGTYTAMGTTATGTQADVATINTSCDSDGADNDAVGIVFRG